MTRCAKIRKFIKKANHIMSLEDEMDEYEFKQKINQLKEEYNNLLFEQSKVQDCTGFKGLLKTIGSFSLN